MDKFQTNLNKQEKIKIINLITEKHDDTIFDKIKELIDSGEDINEKDNYGMTALHYSCKQGNYKLTELLIKLGANKYSANLNWKKPIEFAIVFEYKKIVDLLSFTKDKSVKVL